MFKLFSSEHPASAPTSSAGPLRPKTEEAPKVTLLSLGDCGFSAEAALQVKRLAAGGGEAVSAAGPGVTSQVSPASPISPRPFLFLLPLLSNLDLRVPGDPPRLGFPCSELDCPAFVLLPQRLLSRMRAIMMAIHRDRPRKSVATGAEAECGGRTKSKEEGLLAGLPAPTTMSPNPPLPGPPRRSRPRTCPPPPPPDLPEWHLLCRLRSKPAGRCDRCSSQPRRVKGSAPVPGAYRRPMKFFSRHFRMESLILLGSSLGACKA